MELVTNFMGSSSLLNAPLSFPNIKRNQNFKVSVDCFFSQHLTGYCEQQLNTRMMNFMRRHLESCSVCEHLMPEVALTLEVIEKAIPVEKIDLETEKDLQRDVLNLLKELSKTHTFKKKNKWWELFMKIVKY